MIINKCNNFSADGGKPPKNWTAHITHIMRYAHDAAYHPICRGIPPSTEKNIPVIPKIIMFLIYLNVNLCEKWSGN